QLLSTLMLSSLSFFVTAPAPTEIYTLSLHDALPICLAEGRRHLVLHHPHPAAGADDPLAFLHLADPAELEADGGVELQRVATGRSEEHTSELQSRENLVCRLLLEKKKKKKTSEK